MGGGLTRAVSQTPVSPTFGASWWAEGWKGLVDTCGPSNGTLGGHAAGTSVTQSRVVGSGGLSKVPKNPCNSPLSRGFQSLHYPAFLQS